MSSSGLFSCLSREYKYFFWRENLNLLAMEEADNRFLGEHDFRNFSKMDAVNVHNYKRHITLFEICPSDVSLSLKKGAQLVVLEGRCRNVWESVWSNSCLDLHQMSSGAAQALWLQPSVGACG